jgi:hypothetical protein
MRKLFTANKMAQIWINKENVKMSCEDRSVPKLRHVPYKQDLRDRTLSVCPIWLIYMMTLKGAKESRLKIKRSLMRSPICLSAFTTHSF